MDMYCILWYGRKRFFVFVNLFKENIGSIFRYLEPTIAVLIHRNLSYTGRIAISSDTCYVAALSINTREKSYHLIWNVTGLPYDCHYMRKIPRPIGGLLVFSTGSIIYVQQGVPSHGVSLNSMAVGGTRFTLKPVPNVVAVLDGSQCAFFESDRMLLALRNGITFVVTLIYDKATRTFQDFHWQQVLVNRYASCIVPLEGSFNFEQSLLKSIPSTPRSFNSIDSLISSIDRLID